MKKINMTKKRHSQLVLGTVLLGSTLFAQADIIHNDDVLTMFSHCIGNDCVNGESFGFDTLRLKENNLRIHFQDTSTSASFPTNDWRIIINDSSNGGASYFRIEDSTAGRSPFQIDAGAPSNSLRVDSQGDVGIGASAPVVELHVKDGDSPTLRLEQDGSSGFTPQTWDVAGNETNFFVRDVTNGSKLSFKIKPGAPTSSLFVAADGDIGMGTENPEGDLEIVNSSDHAIISIDATASNKVSTIKFDNGNVPKWYLSSRNDFGTPTDKFSILNASAEDSFVITQDKKLALGGLGTTTHAVEHQNGAHLTAGGTWNNGSSRSLKDDIANLKTDEAYKALMKLEPVKFSYKLEPGEQYIGFIAEDVPELVATNERKSLSSMDIVAVLTKVVQQQQKNIEELSEKLAKLEDMELELKASNN